MNWLEFLGLTTKSVAVSSVGVESEDDDVTSKSQWKHEKKISAQSSQIKDLCGNFDSAIAENSQMQEFFNPNTLQTAFTNVLHAAHTSSGPGHSYQKVKFFRIQSNASLSWADPGKLSFQLGRMGLLAQKSLACIARTQGMSWGIVYICITGKNF